MRTGTIVLGICSSDRGEREAVDRCVRYLTDNGRENVRPAYHFGSPDSYGVMKDMFLNDGVDTFCVLPLTVSEGDLTIWKMPKALTLPDNSGSWTKIGENDVATRFATALGFEEAIASRILEDLGNRSNGKGVLLISYGSKLSQSEKTARLYASRIEKCGWDVECGFARFGRTAKDAAEALIVKGCSEIEIVPLMISTEGKAFSASISELREMGCKMNIHRPVSGFDEFYEILDRKVPEGW